MVEKSNQKKIGTARKDLGMSLETALRNASSWSRKRWQQEITHQTKVHWSFFLFLYLLSSYSTRLCAPSGCVSKYRSPYPYPLKLNGCIAWRTNSEPLCDSRNRRNRLRWLTTVLMECKSTTFNCFEKGSKLLFPSLFTVCLSLLPLYVKFEQLNVSKWPKLAPEYPMRDWALVG